MIMYFGNIHSISLVLVTFRNFFLNPPKISHFGQTLEDLKFPLHFSLTFLCAADFIEYTQAVMYLLSSCYVDSCQVAVRQLSGSCQVAVIEQLKSSKQAVSKQLASREDHRSVRVSQPLPCPGHLLQQGHGTATRGTWKKSVLKKTLRLPILSIRCDTNVK